MGWVVVGMAVFGALRFAIFFCREMLYFPGFRPKIGRPTPTHPIPHLIRADFREGDEDSNFSVFTVNGPNLFTELPFL